VLKMLEANCPRLSDKVANVPVVGKVRVVPAVAVRAIGKAPEVEKASAKLTVLPAARVNVPVLAV